MAQDGGPGDPDEQALTDRLALLEARIGDLEDALIRNRVLVRNATAGSFNTPTQRPAWPPAAPERPTSTATPGLAAWVPVQSPSAPAQPASALATDAPTARSALPPAPTPETSPAAHIETAASPGPTHPAGPTLARTIADLEERLTGRALAWAGGVALVLGAIFFMSLAFSRNWIGPEGRVLIGLAAGAAGLAGGAVLLERGNRLLGHVLAPIGLAVISISLVGATRLYDVIPVELALAVALASAGLTAVIAVRANSQTVAGFGLVAVLAAPPLLGAPADLTTLGFIGIALSGTTAIALWKTWSWLPPVAFLLTAPQAASWILGRPDAPIALIAAIVFWLLNVVAAGGEEFRRRRNDFSSTSASLLMVNAAFLVWSGFVVLDGNLTAYRGAFLVLVALAHLGIGGYFVARDGDENLFGLLVIGTGIAALTMAAPVQLGAPWVPVAWTAEAVALAWVAVKRAHVHAAISSTVLYLLAALDVVSLFQPDRAPAGIPFLNGPGGALVFFLGGIALGIWIVRERGAQAALAAAGLFVAAWAAIMELSGPAITIALALLTVAATATWRYLPSLTERPVAWRLHGLIEESLRSLLDYSIIRPYLLRALPLALMTIGAATTTHLAFADYGSTFLGSSSGNPFADQAGVGLLCFLVAIGGVIALDRDRMRAELLIALGTLVLVWASARELSGLDLVVAWTVLALGLVALWSLLPKSDEPKRPVRAQPWPLPFEWALPAAALVSGGLALLHVLTYELPLASFGQVTPPGVPFTDTGAASGAFLVVAGLVAGFIVGGPAARRTSILVAGAIVAYLVPYEVYAWAVAILWALIAFAAVMGARLDRRGTREYTGAALAMLAGTAWVAILIVAPPTRLVVSADRVAVLVALQSAVALASLAASSGVVVWSNRSWRWARWAELAVGLVIVYLLSVAVVDAFATRVGGSVATEELQKQGQVAVSVTWAISGVVAFVAGLRFRRAEVRQAGLGLLAVATAKVFIFDFSELDVAYRVVSLIALGLILLLSAGLWQRLRPPQLATVAGGSSDAERQDDAVG